MSNPSRVQSGVPTGGQFAATVHGAGDDVTLTGGATADRGHPDLCEYDYGTAYRFAVDQEDALNPRQRQDQRDRYGSAVNFGEWAASDANDLDSLGRAHTYYLSDRRLKDQRVRAAHPVRPGDEAAFDAGRAHGYRMIYQDPAELQPGDSIIFKGHLMDIVVREDGLGSPAFRARLRPGAEVASVHGRCTLSTSARASRRV